MTTTTEFPGQKEFEKFVDQSIEWFKWRAQRVNWFYNANRLGLIILSAALPASVILGERYQWVAIGVAFGIAVLAGLDAQFRPGDQWQHHRSTQLALMRMKRAYEYNRTSENKGQSVFEAYFAGVEALLEAEASRYWSFRITDWQKPEESN